jgi:hypothetical protein
MGRVGQGQDGLNKNHTRERLLVVLYTALVPKETTSGAP